MLTLHLLFPTGNINLACFISKEKACHFLEQHCKVCLGLFSMEGWFTFPQTRIYAFFCVLDFCYTSTAEPQKKFSYLWTWLRGKISDWVTWWAVTSRPRLTVCVLILLCRSVLVQSFTEGLMTEENIWLNEQKHLAMSFRSITPSSASWVLQCSNTSRASRTALDGLFGRRHVTLWIFFFNSQELEWGSRLQSQG